MKDNKLAKFTLFVLLITLVAIALVSGTYAKYTTTVTGSDTAVVAKWSIKVNDDEMATLDADGNLNEAVTFDLFNTADGNVDTGLIAPGTAGEFALNVKNESEVNATYSIDFTVSETKGPKSDTAETIDIPVKFSVDSGKTWTDTLEDITDQDLSNEDGNNEASLTVQWKWDYEVDDTADTVDTKLGIAARAEEEPAPQITVTAVINAVQVD